MKKVLLTLAVLGTISLSSCEKDSLVAPESATLKADKSISCRQCGAGWDITDPQPDPTALRSASTTTETDTAPVPATPIAPVKPGKR